MQALLCPLLQLYTVALILRAVMSWFPVGPDSGVVPVMRMLDTVINPLLIPLRRVIPPLGPFDMSFLVLLILVQIVHGFVCGGAIL